MPDNIDKEQTITVGELCTLYTDSLKERENLQLIIEGQEEEIELLKKQLNNFKGGM